MSDIPVCYYCGSGEKIKQIQQLLAETEHLIVRHSIDGPSPNMDFVRHLVGVASAYRNAIKVFLGEE